MGRRAVYVTAGVVLCLFVVSAWVSAQPEGPYLVNARFEQGFTVREASEVEVAVGWDYAYLSGDDRECRAPCSRPEFKPETEIVAQGEYSQRWFTTFARQFAALHQEIETEPGQWYEFSCDVYAISEPDGQQALFVGANPWGGGVFDRTMVWGQQQPWGSYREWHRAAVTFQAFGHRARVAIGSNNQWATKNNAAYVDQCTIRAVGGPVGPTPEPCPTCEPGGECDYARLLADVATLVAEREPVKWPR